MVWTVSTFLFSLWNLRRENKKVELYRIRSELEAECSLLRLTKYCNVATLTDQILAVMFPP